MSKERGLFKRKESPRNGVSFDSFIPIFSMIFLKVFASISKKFNIFWSIVVFHPIYVMSPLFWLKVSTNLFFHYKTVFKNIAIAIRKRMVWLTDKNITLRTFMFSPSPCGVKFPLFPKKKFGMRKSLLVFIKTLYCTKQVPSFVCLWKEQLLTSMAFVFSTNTNRFHIKHRTILYNE